MIASATGPMLYDFPLRTAGLVTGLALLLSHLWALWKGEETRAWLRGFPRSRTAGTILITLAAVWCTWIVYRMELGEFARFRTPLLVGIPVSAWLLWRYVEEFLAVRALGMLALLAAEPLLEAAFLRPEVSRLFLVSLVYLWIIGGMFLVGTPYLLRDAIAWVTSCRPRWNLAAVAGVAYGALLCLLSFGW